MYSTQKSSDSYGEKQESADGQCTYNQKSEVMLEDYVPGELLEHLCQRFSELPQFEEAPIRIQQVFFGLGYANVMGIFLAGQFKNFISPITKVDPIEWQEFPNWVDYLLDATNIAYDDPGIVEFQKFAALAKLLRHTPGHDSFDWLIHSPSHLEEEALLKADCERLVHMKIEKTSDLAQKSVDFLLNVFQGDDFAMQRLAAFLDKRNLWFGMNLKTQFGPQRK